MSVFNFSKSLLSTNYAKISGMESSTQKVIKFLLENRTLKLNDETMKQIFATKLRTMTPLAAIFETISDSEASAIYTGFFPGTGRNLISVPDLLTLSSITIDLAGIRQADILSGFSEYKNKVIINFGGIMKYTGQGDNIYINDAHELQNLIVRGALCRSYLKLDSNTQGWLTPALAKFVIESYAMCMSHQLTQTYGFSYPEQIQTSAFFAFYMAKLLWNDPYGIPPTFYMCNFLGSKLDIQELVDRHRADFERDYTLETACNLINSTGPERIRKTFDSYKLMQMCSRLGSDNISNILATQYPPYWVHQIILALSGGKSSLIYPLKQYKLLEPAKKFVQELNLSQSFIPKLV